MAHLPGQLIYLCFHYHGKSNAPAHPIDTDPGRSFGAGHSNGLLLITRHDNVCASCRQPYVRGPCFFTVVSG